MANSRMTMVYENKLVNKEGFEGVQYKPGFVDHISLETLKVSLDREFDQINITFSRNLEVLKSIIDDFETRIKALENP